MNSAPGHSANVNIRDSSINNGEPDANGPWRDFIGPLTIEQGKLSTFRDRYTIPESPSRASGSGDDPKDKKVGQSGGEGSKQTRIPLSRQESVQESSTEVKKGKKRKNIDNEQDKEEDRQAWEDYLLKKIEKLKK